MNILYGLMGMGILILLLMIIIPILILTFWILMIIDCAKRNFRNSTDKIVWILIILLANIIGALIYYFVIKIRK